MPLYPSRHRQQVEGKHRPALAQRTINAVWETPDVTLPNASTNFPFCAFPISRTAHSSLCRVPRSIGQAVLGGFVDRIPFSLSDRDDNDGDRIVIDAVDVPEASIAELDFEVVGRAMKEVSRDNGAARSFTKHLFEAVLQCGVQDAPFLER